MKNIRTIISMAAILVSPYAFLLALDNAPSWGIALVAILVIAILVFVLLLAVVDLFAGVAPEKDEGYIPRPNF